MKHLFVIACALFLVGTSRAQTTASSANADNFKTESKAEAPANDQQGAAATIALPSTNKEVKSESTKAEKVTRASEKKSVQSVGVQKSAEKPTGTITKSESQDAGQKSTGNKK